MPRNYAEYVAGWQQSQRELRELFPTQFRYFDVQTVVSRRLGRFMYFGGEGEDRRYQEFQLEQASIVINARAAERRAGLESLQNAAAAAESAAQRTVSHAGGNAYWRAEQGRFVHLHRLETDAAYARRTELAAIERRLDERFSALHARSMNPDRGMARESWEDQYEQVRAELRRVRRQIREIDYPILTAAGDLTYAVGSVVGLNAVFDAIQSFREGDVIGGAISAIEAGLSLAPYIRGAFALRLGRGAGAVSSGGTIRSAIGSEGQVVTSLRDFYSARQIGRSPSAPSFYSVPGSGRGRIWVSIGNISQNDFAPLVRTGSTRGRVTIISGAHGTANGATRLDRALFLEDLTRWAGEHNVNLLDIGAMSEAQLTNALSDQSRIIYAICNGEQSQALLRALGSIP